MCLLCQYVSDDGWTRIKWGTYNKLKRELHPSGPCGNFQRVHMRELCFHDSHNNVLTERSDCQHKRRHETATLFLMNKSSEVLPDPLHPESIPQLYSQKNITKMAISVDKSVRKEKNTRTNDFFARTGYTAFPIQFDGDDSRLLETMMGAVVRETNKTQRRYLDGRFGHPFTQDHLHMYGPDLCRIIFDRGLLNTVQCYMACEEPPKIFEIEVIRMNARARQQRRHGDAADIEKKVMMGRVAVTAMISTGHPITKVVYPNSRSDKTWDRSFEDDNPGIRATDKYNCIAFDSTLVHYGVENASNIDTHRLCITFIHPYANDEQRGIIERELTRKSLDLSPEELRNISRSTRRRLDNGGNRAASGP